MNRWMMALGTLVALTNVGCAPVVLDPVTQDPDGGSSGADGGSPISALAILAKDLPAVPSGSPAQIVGSTDPDALVLLFSNLPQACATGIIGGVCPDELEWQGIVILPSDLVRVGLVDLANPRIASFSFEYFDAACSGGGGGGIGLPMSGTLEIVSTDAGSITVNLLGGITGAQGGTMNGVTQPPITVKGTFTASRCEAAPAPPAPSAAVAISGANLPAGLPSSPTIAATPDPTALYLFLGTGTQTCADPLSSLGCGDARITLSLPSSLQQPGTIDLSDPRLAASIAIAGDGSANCTTTVGSFMTGTLTIASIDASGISFSLYQTLTTTPAGASFDADGLYQATVCP